MLLSIITPEKVEWSGEVVSVNLPSVTGEITILPGHIDMICALKAGEVRIMEKKDGVELPLYISEGTAQVSKNEVIILTEEALKAADITSVQVEEAKLAALKAKGRKEDDLEFAGLEANLRRELAKEKVMEGYKKKTKRVGN